MSLRDLPWDLVFEKKGPRAALRRIKCWWRGGHDWNKTEGHTRPYPLRPLYCRQCGAKWKYFTARIPPARPGHALKECPKCWMMAEHKLGEDYCTCDDCGWEFKVSRRAKHTCEHCSRKVYLGENCPGCGAPA